ncbi:MAG: HAMP domain-containing sensor histidine kinase [Alphaproteobacteria bacterium]|nr:HAMP domain-containing sensor histidine kinase [Alphaproteobacteria bacterium]
MSAPRRTPARKLNGLIDHAVRVGLGLVTATFLVLTVAALVVSWQALKASHAPSYDRSGIAAIQIRFHHERLIRALIELEAGRAGADVAAASLEFDILSERVQALPTRPPYDRILDSELQRLVREITEVLAHCDAKFEAAQTRGSASLIGVADTLAGLRPTLDRLSARAVQVASETFADERTEWRRSATMLTVLVVGLIVSGGLFGVALSQALRRNEAQVEQLQRLSTELRLARDDAVTANRAKSNFLASMSHELRTPLNAIRGFSESLLAVPALRADQQRVVAYLEHIHTSSGQLAGLIDDLLDLSVIEADGRQITPEAIDAGVEVRRAVDMVLSARPEARARVTLTVPDQPLPLVADAKSLRQVVVNLTTNSILYSGADAQITVQVQAGDGKTSSAPGVLLTIADTGPGIPEEVMDRIGQVFIHAHQAFVGPATNQLRRGGAGLGLSIVTKLMALAGGRVSIDNRPTEGVTFQCWWPPEPPAPTGATQ